MSVSVLHLSDIHVGPGELRDEDLKDHVPDTMRRGMLARLRNYLADLDREFDYAVVTGDITIGGDAEGFSGFRDWLIRAVEDRLLPAEKRILVVPGNHDVKWLRYGEPDHANRYSDFSGVFATVFPHAYLPGCDPEPGRSWLTHKALEADYVGGIRTQQKHGTIKIKASYPFVLDNERDLLIYMFNSTLACGVFLEDSPGITSRLHSLADVVGKSEPSVGEGISRVKQDYCKSLRIDAGLIGDDQLNYFEWAMGKLAKLLKRRFDRLTKLAVMHHHVSHLWQQQLEVKRFESVIDAAQLKQCLHERGFHAVLHGHKHQNHVALDASMIPLESDRAFNPLCLISGGTVAGYPRTGDHQSFKILRLECTTGPRTSALVEEFDLSGIAVPSARGSDCLSTYHIPISPRLPEIQDWPPIKEAFDRYLLESCGTPDDVSSANVTSKETDLTLPTAHPEILAGNSNYRFMQMVEYDRGEEGNVRVFFDVLLAAQRLGFRQRARIYQILTDIAAHQAKNGVRNELVLIIGDLGNTAFFQGDTQGEIGSSVEELKRYFGSAVDSGLLKVVHHELKQEEVDALLEAAQPDE